MKFYDYILRVLTLIAVLTLVSLLTYFGVAIVKSASSDGKVDYCRIAYHPATAGSGSVPYYEVIGHRNWREDATIINTTSSEEANKALENCNK
jgi:hypothetical protein